MDNVRPTKIKFWQDKVFWNKALWTSAPIILKIIGVLSLPFVMLLVALGGDNPSTYSHAIPILLAVLLVLFPLSCQWGARLAVRFKSKPWAALLFLLPLLDVLTMAILWGVTGLFCNRDLVC